MSLSRLTAQGMNPIVRMLVISDFFVLAGIGFLGPILPIFIVDWIPDGSVKVAGFASAIYMVMWVLQIPVGRYLDRHHGDRDEYIFLVVGGFITAVALFLFTFAQTPLHIYLIQALAGLGRAIDLPAWYKIFTKKIDRDKEGYDWGVENVTVALAVGFVSALAGLIVDAYGFRALFLIAGATATVGASILFLLYRSVFPKRVS